jgi:hypothetical protein
MDYTCTTSLGPSARMTPDRQHRAKVVTTDVQGIRSTMSMGLIFTIPTA